MEGARGLRLGSGKRDRDGEETFSTPSVILRHRAADGISVFYRYRGIHCFPRNFAESALGT